ncbi:MAG: hypothetical protein A2504_04965 [Bdellovibrionales bacterium RIFOXYD12_FULL_39_22]|nr:MAG: hypothetical protein A2385_06860 [Bdellovibrionales bacterium RIFOXYB1_FULL_39_21]OFZ41987.1 MAG: hypothetical protein A2485_08830 [Bdellovibrionales bacterium RIFOXYC12_FULL_39_17]OFZ50703.1 MAG: hypothetical protein A2404_05780 [Bdellovibrionales bacterium RIFOXYC1_FULL_39_130]OFZ76451.1 MAG: hypothetical protein A2451_09405 [Bdellovibrionales bacterium RIFOXYC2_FULL_39_8]OFZ77926.1 MAG: hypothetical protein A2560_00950 [Bdellovibrionales bacterium RIFOXYD1_FULL_39_84]OFZ93638.1 MAG:
MIIDSPLVQGIKVSFGHQYDILSDFNFEIYKGEMIGLVGQNGCGKTTILKALAKLHAHRTGDILIQKKNISHYSSEELALLVSVVLTDRLNIPNTTVEKIVSLGRYPHTNLWYGLDGPNQAVVNEALHLTGTAQIRNNYFNELSDGQKQKVLIAKAIAQETPLILMDEPTNFLDISSRIEILDILKKIVKQKKISILFSTHDWEAALEVANRVWIVGSNGKMIYGLPEDLILARKLESSLNLANFKFDYDKGKFILLRQAGQSIQLFGGNELFYYWTKHALEKEGYQVVAGQRGQPSSNLPTINIDEVRNSWQLAWAGEIYDCPSIDYLLKWLDHLSDK